MRLLVFAGAILMGLVCLRAEWPADGNWLGVAWAAATALGWAIFFCWLIPRLSFRRDSDPALDVFDDG